jgi:hypothetical protein
MARLARGIGALFALGALVSTRPLSAAPEWVDRPITLPRLVFAGDVGIGVAHLRDETNIRGVPLLRNETGAGLNLEAALGITSSVELGLRTGVRFGGYGRALGADAFGRTLFTETYGTNGDTLANPELRVRWAAYSGRVVEVGLDGRVYLPVEQFSRAGVMAGVPLAFHFGILRIDTGLYVPIIFSEPIGTVISVPVDLWFQVSHRLWLGPMLGFRHIDRGGLAGPPNNLLLGFGLGYQVAAAVDLKWMLLIPNANADDRVVGGGFGLQFRIGE